MGGMAMEKAKDFKGTVKKLTSYLSRHGAAIIIVMIFAMGSTIFNIIGSKQLGNVTQELFAGFQSKLSGGAGIDFPLIGKMLIFLMGLYLLSTICSYIQGILMTGVTQKVTYRMRKEISEKINRLPMKYYDGKTHGEVLSRVTNDADTLSMGLNQSVTQLISSVTMIVGILYMMLSMSWLMTLVALMILPASLGLIGGVIKKSQKYFIEQQVFLGDVNGHVEETYGGHPVIKVFNGEKAPMEQFEVSNKKLYESGWKAQFLSGIMMPLMQFVGNLGYVAIAILGGVLAAGGTINVGNIQSFIQYTKQFIHPIQQIAQVTNMMQSIWPPLKEFLNS